MAPRKGGAQGTPMVAFGLVLLVGFVLVLYLL